MTQCSYFIMNCRVILGANQRNFNLKHNDLGSLKVKASKLYFPAIK